MYRTITQPGPSHLGGSLQHQWSNAAAKRHAAEALEHAQLVEAIHATDGITIELAELQVCAFEKHFKDGSQ